MRAVPATFRLATSQATRASPYVTTVCRPLRQLLLGHLRSQLPVDSKARLGENLWHSILPPPAPVDLPPSGVPSDALPSALRALSHLPAPAHPPGDPAASITATLSSSLSTVLVYGVASDITAGVATTLSSVLDSVSQVEESLGWLRKAQEKGAPAAGASASSEAERVVAQLSLDVLAIASELRDAGAAHVEVFGPFQRCLQQLAEFKKRGGAS